MRSWDLWLQICIILKFLGFKISVKLLPVNYLDPVSTSNYLDPVSGKFDLKSRSWRLISYPGILPEQIVSTLINFPTTYRLRANFRSALAAECQVTYLLYGLARVNYICLCWRAVWICDLRSIELIQYHIQTSSQNMASNCVIFSTLWLHDISENFRSINLKSTVECCRRGDIVFPDGSILWYVGLI